MGKRKVYVRIDLIVPRVDHSLDIHKRALVIPEAISPARTLVAFGRNTTSSRSFDFAPWYSKDIDPITYACQSQVERFLVGEDSVVEVGTVVSYCQNGLRHFLDYLIMRATALGHKLTLADIDRELIDGYLGHLVAMGGEHYLTKELLLRYKICTSGALPAWTDHLGRCR